MTSKSTKWREVAFNVVLVAWAIAKIAQAIACGCV